MNTMQSLIRRVSSLAAVIAVSGGFVACSEHVVTHEVVPTSAYVEVGPPVEHIRAAPEVLYEGHPVYWYQSHWYFRTGGRWTYYSAEPVALRPHRYIIRY